jgi:hypothetical protein
MRKIKVNYQQILDVLAMHLESLGAIKPDEHIELKPFNQSNNMITIYIERNHG